MRIRASVNLGCVAYWLVAATAAAHDPIRLPPVPHSGLLGQGPLGPSVILDADIRPPGQLVSTSPELTLPLVVEAEELEIGPPGARDGVFQRLTLDATWIDFPAEDDFGMVDLELYAVFGFPLPTRDSPLLITPGIAAHYLHGPQAPDLPPRLYDANMQFRWIRPLGGDWTADVAVTPGVYSDFESDDSDMFRLTGRALAIYKWSYETMLVAGVAYLDRSDLPILPVGGLIWTPTPYWKLELVVPRPKIAYLLPGCGADPCVENWVYIAGEYGGGEWAIERAGGQQDVVTLSDLRAIVGVEQKVSGGMNMRLELGWVLDRNIQFDSATPDFEPDSTILVRLGSSY